MVSNETKKRRRKEGQKRKRAARIEVPLPKLEEEADVEVMRVGLDEDAPEYDQFKEIFQKMHADDMDEDAKDSASESSDDDMAEPETKARKTEPELDEHGAPLTSKQRRKSTRYTVAQLKQLCTHPQLVEVHDPNSHDPLFLVQLKAVRNGVPIPRHWCQKRRYLSLKRASGKSTFELPPVIAELGVARTRKEFLDKDADKKAVGESTRSRVARIQVDFAQYERAFRKPRSTHPLTTYGEMYFEGKEKEMKYKSARPGQMSERLRKACGLAEGAPPPWLVNMQKYGPPKSYPSVEIPGLNAPLPVGAQWGYHQGGWGKAPINAAGQPLYGDVFGKSTVALPTGRGALWGAMQADSSDEESEGEGMEGMDDPTEPVLQGGEGARGGVVPEQAPVPAAVPARTMAAVEAPALIDLGLENDASSGREAITVLKQVNAQTAAGSFAPSFRYDLGKVCDDFWG